MPPAEVNDGSAEDFSAGTIHGGAYVARTRPGEVVLAPKLSAEFTGPDLPPHWAVTPLVEGGTGTLDGGALVLDGARAACEPLLLSPRSLEFSAVFASRPGQHVGFGTDFVQVPWVMFSTKWGRRLYGRTHLLNVEDRRLSGHWFDTPHRFRIDWNLLDIEFSVDGDTLGRLLTPVPGYMRVLAANERRGRDPLRLEWVRVSPYEPSGSFTSRVFDAGTAVDWLTASWEVDLPPGTSLGLSVRTGDTADPDEGWSSWRPLAPADDVGATSRFAQYRADLATTDPGRTPALRGVRITYSVGAGSSSSFGSGRALGCQ